MDLGIKFCVFSIKPFWLQDLHIFELSGTALKGKQVVATNDDVMKVQFSPDGAHLTVCTGSKRYTYVLKTQEEFKVGCGKYYS